MSNGSMIWQAVGAIGSLLTVIVIAASAYFALRHVTQLRRAAQLDGTMRIFAQFTAPEFIAARRFVLSELAEKLKDPLFRQELRNYKIADAAKHPEYRVLLFLQLVGSLVKNRLVDGPGIYEFAQYSIIKSWEVLEPVVHLQRESTNNPYMWGGADFLYVSTKQWLEENARTHRVVSPRTGEPFRIDQLQ
jgi:nitrate reductase alpha subunit